MSEQLLSFLVSLWKYTAAAAAAAWRWQNTQNGTRIRRWYSWTVDKQQENIYWSWVHMSHIGVPCCHESVPLLLWLRLIALFFFARLLASAFDTHFSAHAEAHAIEMGFWLIKNVSSRTSDSSLLCRLQSFDFHSHHMWISFSDFLFSALPSLHRHESLIRIAF